MIVCLLLLIHSILNVAIGSDIYFIGGFGTVAWVDVKEYEALQPDKIAVDGGERNLKVRYFRCLLIALETPINLLPILGLL